MGTTVGVLLTSRMVDTPTVSLVLELVARWRCWSFHDDARVVGLRVEAMGGLAKPALEACRMQYCRANMAGEWSLYQGDRRCQFEVVLRCSRQYKKKLAKPQFPILSTATVVSASASSVYNCTSYWGITLTLVGQSKSGPGPENASSSCLAPLVRAQYASFMRLFRSSIKLHRILLH